MQNSHWRIADRSALLVGISLGTLLAATPALAQTAPPPTQPPAGQPTTPTSDQQKAAQNAPATVPTTGGDTAVTENQNNIVITGTRIRQPEFTSPDPVARIDPQIAQQAGKLDTADMLQSSPIASGSTQITSALSSNFVTNGGPGSETIDLRGLGPNRTLVLLNGRRAGPAGTRGGVSSFDLNVLPQSIVQRVDVLKTGASSIYGSDAVAGVVNLITKTDFNGLQVDGFANVPTHKGGEVFSGSVLWGKSNDRGHIMVALDYYKQNELARGDRSYLSCPAAYVFKQGSNTERADLIDPRTGKYHCEDLPVGQVWTYDLEYFYGAGNGALHLADGTYVGPVNLMQFQYPGEHLGIPPVAGCGDVRNNCITTPPGWFPTGYDPASYAVQNDFNPYANEQTIIPKTKRYTLYADASYEFSDAIEGYAEFLANRRETYQNGWRQFWTFGFGGGGSYCGFLDCNGNDPGGIYPGNNASYWAPDWGGWTVLSPTAVTNRGSDSKQRVDYWRAVGGLRGDLGGFLKGWAYDAYVQYSHNKGLYSQEQILQDAIDASSYQTSSCAGTTLPFSHKQCMDLPWLDPNFLMGKFTAAQADYLFDWETGKTIYTQLSGEASMNGNLVDLPAGPVGVALGVAARRDYIDDRPGDITYMVNPYYDPNHDPSTGHCGAPLYVCSPTVSNAWGNTASGITIGHEVTTEAFGEVQVPLIKDHPFFRDLSFNGAARVTNVKAVQGGTGVSENNKWNWTYKLGANWAVSPLLRFRGTYGTSFRAPALYEEFKANETSFIGARAIDPCVNWALNLQQGNIDQRIADNCASQGIPSNYRGGSITTTVISQGGIGQLKPETSKAKTASVILTPSFSFLPHTRMSLAVDWFDIEVKGEISQLGAGTILFQCYDSENFPNDPLCSLFTRGQPSDPFAVATVHDKYINISTQKNRGVDFTALITQGLGRWGSLTLLGNATYQLKDSIVLLPGSPAVSNNGDIGDPKFVGDFNATWKPGGGWTAFWGTEVYGSASNEQKFKDRHGGSLCQTSPIWGDYCVVAKVPATFYHNVSITKDFGDEAHRLEMTLGIRNLFDTRPPRVSTIGGAGLPSEIGPVVGTSQYDFLGRRVFFNISKKF
jgi:iron complex outermembrane receptor protein